MTMLKRLIWIGLLGPVIASLLAVVAASPTAQDSGIRFVGKTKYLNNARAAVVHSIDDSTKLVATIADSMDKYDIKGTFFISTEQDPPPEERFFNQLQVWLLWPRMQKAVENGHEVGAHAITHPCHRPQSDTTSEDYKSFCTTSYTDAELKGSRDTILQPHDAAVRLDLGLSVRPLRDLRFHPETDRRRRLHRGAQLSGRGAWTARAAGPADVGGQLDGRAVHAGRAEGETAARADRCSRT